MAIIIDHIDEEWEKEKNEWKKKIQQVNIPEDLQQGAIHHLQHLLDKYYAEGSWYLTYYESQYKNLEEMIDAVRKRYGSEGSNDKEREANAYDKLMNYPYNDNGDTVNLIVSLSQLREKYYFFKNYVIKNLSKKDSRIMTNVGASKVEAAISGRPGA